MPFDLSKFEHPQDADDFVDLALKGLGAIAGLVGGNVGTVASETLAGVKAVVTAIFDGYEGTVTFDEVRAELKKLTDNLAANDASADAALKAKFKAADTVPGVPIEAAPAERIGVLTQADDDSNSDE